MHYLTAWWQWVVDLLQYTASLPWCSVQCTSFNALPHCLGQWAVELLHPTASLRRGSEQCNCCNTLPHCPGAVGSVGWGCGGWECSFMGSRSKDRITPPRGTPRTQPNWVCYSAVWCSSAMQPPPPPRAPQKPPSPPPRPQMVWHNSDACPLGCFALCCACFVPVNICTLHHHTHNPTHPSLTVQRPTHHRRTQQSPTLPARRTTAEHHTDKNSPDHHGKARNNIEENSGEQNNERRHNTTKKSQQEAAQHHAGQHDTRNLAQRKESTTHNAQQRGAAPRRSARHTGHRREPKGGQPSATKHQAKCKTDHTTDRCTTQQDARQRHTPGTSTGGGAGHSTTAQRKQHNATRCNPAPDNTTHRDTAKDTTSQDSTTERQQPNRTRRSTKKPKKHAPPPPTTQH